jgi:2-keto-3-deoxy-L-fuconate dehydrogenase
MAKFVGIARVLAIFPSSSMTSTSLFSLANKTALVSGAASGIGAAIATRLAAAGAFVYLADINRAEGEKMVATIQKDGGNSEFLQLNVADGASCQKAASRIFEVHKQGLDILVNNAGIGHVGTILNTTPEDLDRLYAVNVKGVFHLCKIFLPTMIEKQSGSIINLASIGGVVGVRDRLAYCATKFAVVGLTKAMALDHAGSKVRINCICPGRVETPFVQSRIKEYSDPEKAYREMASTQALGRMGTPEEIAAAAHYLASDEAAFITGSELIIDGGFSAGK